MTYVIGIYQQKEQVENQWAALRNPHRDIMEVGPFSSRLQALQWMEYMEERLTPHAVERYTPEPFAPNIWYGAAFEVD